MNDRLTCAVDSITFVVHCDHCDDKVSFSKTDLRRNLDYHVMLQGKHCIVAWDKICPKCKHPIEFGLEY